MAHIFFRLSVLSVLSALLMGCDPSLNELEVLGTLERDRIELTSDTNEPIIEVLVREGQSVSQGDALVAQNTSRVDAALARAEADEAVALAALTEAEQGPRAQEIRQARARLLAATSAAQTARHELERQKQLVQRNFTTQSTVSILQGRYDEALAREDEARAGLDELLEGTRNEKIDQARSRYAAARATVRDLRITLDRATLRSPVDGIVEVLPFELGERPPANATVVTVLADAPVYARVHLPQTLRMSVAPGTTALIHIDGREGPLSARVRWVAAQASFTPYYALTQHDRSRLSFLAEVDVEGDVDDALPVGVPVQVTFPDLEE